MEREPHVLTALVSPKPALVSRRFTVRFTLHAQLRV